MKPISYKKMRTTTDKSKSPDFPKLCFEMLNNEEQLELIGFVHFQLWDFKDPFTPNFRFDFKGKTYRAFVTRCNGPVYAQLGIVINEKGHVDRWRDCCSRGSVARKVLLSIKGDSI